MKNLIIVLLLILLAGCDTPKTEFRLLCEKDDKTVTFESPFYRFGSIEIIDGTATISAKDQYGSTVTLSRKIRQGETCYTDYRDVVGNQE
jgi:hypothetical protein